MCKLAKNYFPTTGTMQANRSGGTMAENYWIQVLLTKERGIFEYCNKGKMLRINYMTIIKLFS